MKTVFVRVRFAPSPTGYLHIGAARTALFNWLFARHHGGAFVLRIEDTDQSRLVSGAVEAIYGGLLWLGLKWDEGPDIGGPFGPYTQSKRLDIYTTHAAQLVEAGHAYPCFCTSERLEELREYQRINKQPPGYDRRCRNLSREEIDANRKAGMPHVVRMKVPLTGETRFDDVVRGTVKWENRNIDDFVLLKSDGYPTYHLANVVDDHLMRISHVIRGEEWISSTPKHALLYEAFGWQNEVPTFVHVPSILSPDGGKLSKRKGAAAVTDFGETGYLPEAVRNFIALLGWSPGDDREKMTLDEMIDSFTLERVNPKGAIFDEQKLEWLNGEYIKQSSADELLPIVKPLWVQAGLLTEAEVKEREEYVKRVIDLVKSRTHRVTDFVDLGAYWFRDPDTYDEKARKKHWTDPEVSGRMRIVADQFATVPEFTAASAEQVVRLVSQELGVSAASLIHPIRLAVTGMSFGPGLFEILEVVGRNAVVRRLRKAASVIEGKP